MRQRVKKAIESNDSDNYDDKDEEKSGSVSNGYDYSDGNGVKVEDNKVMNEAESKKAIESDDGDNYDDGDEKKLGCVSESVSSSDKKGSKIERFQPLKSSSSVIEEIDIGNKEYHLPFLKSSQVYNPF